MERITETQVAIIGGGIVGTALAHALCQYQVDVCLLEKEPAVGFGITKGSQGGLHGGIAIFMSKLVKWWEGAGDLRAYLSNLEHLKDKLNDPGKNMYVELEPFLKARIRHCGRVMVAETQDDMENMKLFKELAEDTGAEGIVLLDKDGLREKEPLINTRFIGGLYDPHPSTVISTEWATAFAENAAINGAHILLNTKVTGIEEKNGGYLIRTNKGPVKAEYIVNAAGIFSDEIAKMIGIIVFYSLSFIPKIIKKGKQSQHSINVFNPML